MKHWETRLIRKGGYIKFNGAWWHPDEFLDKYDGSLDGLWYLFAEYEGAKEPTVYMWGPKEMADCKECSENHSHFQPEIDKNGCIRWMFWEPVKERTFLVTLPTVKEG